MQRFFVIGITDNPQPWFPPEVLEVIKKGRVFSGGKRHHEIVAPLLPADAQWIDITVPLDNVFAQYQSQTSNLKPSLSSPVAIRCFLALQTPSSGRCLRQRSCFTPPSIPCNCWLIDW